MKLTEFFLISGLLTPLITSSLVYFFRRNANLRDLMGPIGGILTFISACFIAQDVINGNTPTLKLVPLFPGVDLIFSVNPLGAIFGLVASFLWIAASIYTVGYMRGNNEKNQTRFAFFYAIAIHAAMGIAWSGNLLILFVFYEILTFSTYPLVTHKQTDDAKKAGRLYMSILVGSSVVFLFPAILWVWYASGTLNFSDGGIISNNIPSRYLPFLLGLFAFGIGKAALMPIHKWLPAAMVAPTPVSALLHAVAVVKAGVFSILIIVVYIFGHTNLLSSGASEWLIWLSSFTIIASSIVAISKDDLKARLAYSTISQLSYIVLGAALASTIAIQGAALHIVMHAVGKITLFFVAGVIYVSLHLTKVSELDGQGKSMPLVFLAFFIGSLSIIGVPPMGGSWSKLFLMLGAVQSEYLFIIVILCLSTLLNVYYLLEIPARAFFKNKKKEIQVNMPIMAATPTVFTAFLTIVLFFYLEPFSKLIDLMVGK